MIRKTSFLLPFLIFAVASGAAYSADEMATVDYVDEQFLDAVGYVDSKTRTINNNLKASDTQLYDNQIILRDMLNTKDADGNWITLDTEEQLAIPAINELHTEMAGKQDLISAEKPLAVENVSGLADVAKTGSFNDLVDAPTIPSIEGLVTDEDFQDALATKQSKLTTGSGITIEETTADDGTVTATISADVNLEDVVGEITDAQGNTITIQQALESKADASTVDTLEGLVGDTSVAKQITDKVGTIADGKTVAEVLDTKADASALTEYAKSADVADTYATKDSLSEYATTGALADKEDAANKLVSATAEEIEAMSSDEKATKFPTVAVAQTIANAAVTKVNEVAGDLSSLQTQVGTNTADIAEIKEAGYQTLDDVQGEIKTATADLVSENDLGALAYKNTVATADIDSKSVTLDKIAGVVPGENKTMLMSVDAEGNVTWMSVEILK